MPPVNMMRVTFDTPRQHTLAPLFSYAAARLFVLVYAAAAAHLPLRSTNNATNMRLLPRVRVRVLDARCRRCSSAATIL